MLLILPGNIGHPNSGYSLDVELIPRISMVDGCPINTDYRVVQLKDDSLPIHTCSCENHCSWDMCNLVHPPIECVVNTSSSWYWDSRKNAWVAQVILGNI